MVRSGTGGLQSFRNGVGTFNVTLNLLSGIGHHLGYVVNVYGVANATTNEYH